MGGGFMFTGNSRSFAAPRPPCTAGATRGFQTHDSPTAVFGPAPSRVEVETAILELQRLMQSTTQSKIDGLHGLLHLNDPKLMIQSPGFIEFNDAFNMMQKESSFQNMVISISCDKAVWDSILSNKAVQNLQGSTALHLQAKDEKPMMSYDEEQDITILIVKWIAGFAKSVLSELVGKFASLVSDVFESSSREKAKDKPTSELTRLLEEKIRSSLLLSVVILLIVVVTRNQG